MTYTAADLEFLRDAIGNTEESRDFASPMQIHGLAALLDKPDVPQMGDPIGPMGHWCYFYPRVPASGIGADGHPERGGFLPPTPLPRRMFGGCRTTYRQDVLIGEEIVRKARIKDVAVKDGRTGILVIVTVAYEIESPRGLCIEEEHDIVYRDNPPAEAADSRGNSGKTGNAPTDHAFIREIVPDPVMLFRYSAVTFNGHRIHYDRKYVTEVEGYPGLIVHGPLTTTHMLELGMAEMPGRRVARYDFQARAPLFDVAPFHVAGKPGDDGNSQTLWSVTPEGNLGTIATVTYD